MSLGNSKHKKIGRIDSHGSFGDSSEFRDTFNDVDDRDNGLNSLSASSIVRQKQTQKSQTYPSNLIPMNRNKDSISLKNSKTTISSTYKSSIMTKNKKPTNTLDAFFKPKQKPQPTKPSVVEPLPVPASVPAPLTLASTSKSARAIKPTVQPNVSLKRRHMFDDLPITSLKKHSFSSSTDSLKSGMSDFAKSFYKPGNTIENQNTHTSVTQTRSYPSSQLSSTSRSQSNPSFRPSRFAPPTQVSSTANFDRSSNSHAKHSFTFEPEISPVSSQPSVDNAPIVLSKEQQHVLDLVLKGKSLFYTGAAGTGKSVLTRAIIRELQKSDKEIGITASTGLAAQNIGGETLHRFSGVGLGTASKEQLFNTIRKRNTQQNNWKTVKTLIIDEISMVDGEFFDKLEYIARNSRKSQRPFGGIQIIATGDFFQLPPIDKGSPKSLAFESEAWKSTIQTTFVLTEVFRQKGDNTLINILNSMRLGELTPPMNQKLTSLSRRIDYSDGIEPTELYATRYEVENANRNRLSRLPGPRHYYLKRDEFPLGNSDIQKKSLEKRLDDAVLSPHRLELRHGAQVMLIRNVDSTLVNGSLGRVIAFLTPLKFSKIVYDKGIENMDKDSEEFEKLLQAAEMEEMPLYSNQKNDPLYNTTCLSVSPVPEFEHYCSSDLSLEPVLPVVKFTNSSGETHLKTINPFNFQIMASSSSSSRYTTKKVEAVRFQIPLILSWSISIHKAQGQTLDRVKVDLRTIFEAGHAYVAISRATSMDRLQILNYNPRKVKVNPKVVEFYKSLLNPSSNSGVSTEKDTEKLKRENYINIEPDIDDFFD